MSKNIGRLMHFQRNRHMPEARAVAPPTRGQSRLWLTLLVCLIGSTAASFVLFKYVAPGVLAPSIPPELVGTWQVMDGPLQGATLEFSWYGAATAVLIKDGKKEITNSSAELKGKLLLLTTRDSTTGKDEILTQTVLHLSDDELVIRDEDLHVYRMKRVRS